MTEAMILAALKSRYKDGCSELHKYENSKTDSAERISTEAKPRLRAQCVLLHFGKLPFEYEEKFNVRTVKS